MNKRIKNVLVTVMCVMFATTTVFAATKSRETYYAMKGGVFSKSMDIKKNGSLKVKMTPSVANSYDCPILIYVDQKHWWGWGGSGLSGKEVNSHESKTVKFKVSDKATYRVYLSSPWRYYVEGKVKFTWDAQ